jgi:hypothetical protein
MCGRYGCTLPGFIHCPEDAQLVTMAEKVVALNAEASVAREAAGRIWPEIDRLVKGDPLWRSSKLQRHRAADEHARRSGWEALVTLENDKCGEADAIVKRMWEIPAQTASGRQAKVQALYAHCVDAHPEWNEPIGQGDWGVDMARRLLAEFAGLPA